MNYYEHHIGDYAEATLHLTFVEDAAFSRMIRKYYATERPLPVDVKQVQRIVGARSREEKNAVETILSEFFILTDDGWHNIRCDAEIKRFLDGEPEREVKKANEANRLKRHRDERASLFKKLTDIGQHAPWNIGMHELRDLVGRYCNAPDKPGKPLPATEPETPAMANQSPDTSSHTQPPGLTPLSVSSVIGAPEGDNTTQNDASNKPQSCARIDALCKQVRGLGIAASPTQKAWAELLPFYSDAEILAAAELARERKPSERIHLQYLVPMLKDKGVTVKRADSGQPPWWSSEVLVLKEGARVGISPRPGESMADFKGRVTEKRLEPQAVAA